MTERTGTTPSRASRFAGWLDVRFRSPAAIYGLIVFAAFLSVDSDHATDVWDLLDTPVWSLLVFFTAHVFAHTLTDHGERGLRRATGDAVRHAAGMLYSALPASIVLVIMGLRGASVDDAYEAAMWATVAVLAALGYVAYWRRGAHVLVRLLGALGTTALGALIIILEYALH
ncbi:hypothetical protein ACIQLJ_09470 [Microbacterium sp. NPDC091313]